MAFCWLEKILEAAKFHEMFTKYLISSEVFQKHRKISLLVQKSAVEAEKNFQVFQEPLNYRKKYSKSTK